MPYTGVARTDGWYPLSVVLPNCRASSLSLQKSRSTGTGCLHASPRYVTVLHTGLEQQQFLAAFRPSPVIQHPDAAAAAFLVSPPAHMPSAHCLW